MASEDDDLGRFDNIYDIQETRDKAKEIYCLVKSNPNVSTFGTDALAAVCAYIASSRLKNGDVQRNLALTASSLATMADFESGVSTVEYALGGGHQGRKSRSSTHGFYDRLIEEHRLTAVSGFLKRSMRKAEDFLVMQAVFDVDNWEIKYAIFYWIHAILMPNVRLDHEAFLEETGDTGKFDRTVQLLTSRAVHLKEQITAERGEHVSALPTSYLTPSKTPTRAQRRAKLPSHFNANKDTTLNRSLTLKIPRLSADGSSSSSPRRSPVLRTSEAIDGAPPELPENLQDIEMLRIHEETGESTTQGPEDHHRLPDAPQLAPEEKIAALIASLEEKEAALSAANTNAVNLRTELSSLEMDLKTRNSELAVATETITILRSEMQKQAFEHQQELAISKNKLEASCLSIVNVKCSLESGFKDAQHPTKTHQEPLNKNKMSENAVQTSREMSGIETMSDQHLEMDTALQLSGSGQKEAEHSILQGDEGLEELEEFQDRDPHQGDTLNDDIQKLQDENLAMTARYKRKIDALRHQITSERIAKQQQDILEYLNVTAQRTHLSEAIDDYEPRREKSRRVLMAVRAHLKALDAIGERRRNIPLKYDKLLEVVTNRYGIKEEDDGETGGFDLWGAQAEDEDERLEPRHKKRKIMSVS